MWWRRLVVGVLSIVLFGVPQAVRAAVPSSGSLILKEVLVGTSSDASDEYVVIVNNSSQAVQLQGVELEYKAATGKTWSRRALLAARDLPAGASFKLTTKQAGDAALVSGLAAAGGNLRLIIGGTTLDQLAWGTGDSPEGSVVGVPATGQPLSRKCSPSCIDTGNNASDFGTSTSTSGTTTAAPLLIGKGSIAAPLGNSNYDIEITELMPDPASPQTDNQDEFIELFNAGSSSAQLIGWSLSDGSQSYKLDSIQLQAGQYIALSSATTKLSLNNSGDSVSLAAPDGHVEMTTPNYGKAKAGASFGATPEGWGWLSQPSPGTSNGGLSAEQSADTASKSTTKKSTSSKSTKATKSPQLAKAASAGSTKAGGEQSESTPSNGLSWVWVLAGTGLLAVGYGAYEYRPEIFSFFTKVIAKFKF